VYFFQQLYPPAWIADRRRATAGVAGGCILARREALEQAGGLAAIRDAVIDDCALAALIKRRGGRLRLDLAPDAFSLRPYESWQAVGHLIARTAFTPLRCSKLSCFCSSRWRVSSRRISHRRYWCSHPSARRLGC
jgi:hypothetical protein